MIAGTGGVGRDYRINVLRGAGLTRQQKARCESFAGHFTYHKPLRYFPREFYAEVLNRCTIPQLHLRSGSTDQGNRSTTKVCPKQHKDG